VHNLVKLLKVVAEAIEHCTRDQIRNHDDSKHLHVIAFAKARFTFCIRLCRTIQVVRQNPKRWNQDTFSAQAIKTQ
jgi:hypothetical protein